MEKATEAQLRKRIKELEKALKPFANKSLPGFDAKSSRQATFMLPEKYWARAWFTFHGYKWK